MTCKLAMNPAVMRVAILFIVVFFVILCSQKTEGKTLIRVKKPKIYVSPSHIQSLEQLTEGAYAHDFGYNTPVPGYALHKRVGRQTVIRKKSKGKKKIKIVKWNGGLKTYAKKYRTWAPSKEYLGNRNTIILETPRPKNKRRRPILQPPTASEEEYIIPSGPGGKRRRPKPNSLRSPTPPRPDNIYEYDDEYFPEETKRQEIDYDIDDRYRGEAKKKKKRKPGRKRKPSTTELPKYPQEEELSFPTDGRYGGPSSATGSVSYSTFVQHNTPQDYDYTEPDEDPRYVRNERRKQKRGHQKPETYRDYDEERPSRFKEQDERFPPYYASNQDAVTSPDRSPTKQTRYKPHFEPTPAPIYGDGHIDQSTRYRYIPRPTTQPDYPQDYQTEDYRAYRDTQSYGQPANQYPVRPTPTPTLANDFGPPYSNQDRFPPSDDSYSRPYRDYNAQQTTGFNAPVYPNNPYPKNQVSQVPRYQAPATATGPSSGYQNTGPSYQPSPSYTRPDPARNPVFDNTETFYDFSHNANANSHPSKGIDADFFSPYGNRHAAEKTDQESDFITKHQNLYNNGISGVPIQGDGFAKIKDYDIGYGEYQFDENRGP